MFKVTRRGLSLALRNVLWAQVVGCVVALVYFAAATSQAEPSIPRTFLAMWFGAVFTLVFIPLLTVAFAKLIWDMPAR